MILAPALNNALQAGAGAGSLSPEAIAAIIAAIRPDLTVINNNVKKSSLVIPATEDLPQ